MKTLLSRLLYALVVIVIVCCGSTRANAQTLVPLYQFKYGSNTNFLYTTNFNEIGGSGNGWTYQGISMYIWDAQVEGTIPLYRFYSSTYSKHFFTTNYNEVGAPDWAYEGVVGFIYSQQQTGTVNIRRWFAWISGGPVHYYVVHTAFDSDLEASGYEYEGVVGYAVAP